MNVKICEPEARERCPQTTEQMIKPRRGDQDKLPKLQEKNKTAKQKKHTRKWCEFHKSSSHNASECRVKQSLVAEMRASELDACSDYEPEPDKVNEKWKQIIDVEPNATVATTKIQKEEPEDPEEVECLFHSQMWVKGVSPLIFSLFTTSPFLNCKHLPLFHLLYAPSSCTSPSMVTHFV